MQMLLYNWVTRYFLQIAAEQAYLIMWCKDSVLVSKYIFVHAMLTVH